MSEQQIEVGQVWEHKTGRQVVITRYQAEWDDARYRNIETKCYAAIYGSYLRRDYRLIKAASDD